MDHIDADIIVHPGWPVFKPKDRETRWGLMQASSDSSPFGSVVVRDVKFEQPDVAEVRAELGVSGRTPEFLLLRVSRLGGRWLVEELPPPAQDGGVATTGDAGVH